FALKPFTTPQPKLPIPDAGPHIELFLMQTFSYVGGCDACVGSYWEARQRIELFLTQTSSYVGGCDAWTGSYWEDAMHNTRNPYGNLHVCYKKWPATVVPTRPWRRRAT
ncbi:MAG: hypothetical protein ACKPKO_03720, partial [Candidatus Fonsibacter sp.]